MKTEKLQNLAEYVQGQINQGKSKQEVRSKLLANDWSSEQVGAVFAEAGVASEGSGGQENKTGMSDVPHPHYDEQESQHQQQSAQPDLGGHNMTSGGQSGSDSNEDNSWMGATVFGVLAFVVVGAVGAFAYVGMTGSSEQEISLANMYKAHQSVDTVRYSATTEGSVQLNTQQLQQRDDFDRIKQGLLYVPNTGNIDEVPGQIKGKISLSGPTAFGQPENLQSETNFRVSFGGNEMNKIVDITARFVGGTGYFNAKTLPSLPMIPAQSFEGQWFSFSTSSAPGQFQNMRMSFDKPEGINASTTVSFLHAAHDSGFVTVDSMNSDTLSDGTDVRSYSLTIHPRNGARFVNEVESVLSQANTDFVDSEEFQSFSRRAREFSNASTTPEEIGPITVSVDRNTLRVREISYSKTFSKEDIRQSAGEGPNLQGVESARVSTSLALSGYNEPIEVSAPDEPTPFKEAAENLPFFGGMSEARTSSRDARRQTDLNQIRTALALYRDENGSYPDSLYEGPTSLAESGAISRMPKDPGDDSRYAYTKRTETGDICLGASMEDTADLPADHSEECRKDLNEAGYSVNYAIGN